jgi:hypothetical protein
MIHINHHQSINQSINHQSSIIFANLSVACSVVVYRNAVPLLLFHLVDGEILFTERSVISSVSFVDVDDVDPVLAWSRPYWMSLAVVRMELYTRHCTVTRVTLLQLKPSNFVAMRVWLQTGSIL